MTVDPSFAELLRRRARQFREMAREVDVLECDPSYRTIHDRADRYVGYTEFAQAAKGSATTGANVDT